MSKQKDILLSMMLLRLVVTLFVYTTPPAEPLILRVITMNAEYPNPQPMIAPLFLANSLNWLGLGLVIIQCYYYLQNFRKDPLRIKLLVWCLFILELVQTATTTHQAWWYTVTNWNNPPALLTFPWSAMTVPAMAGIIAAVVQIFYAWRIWTLSHAYITRGISILIVLLALAQAIASIVTAAVFQSHATAVTLFHLHPEFAFWISGSFVADALVAGSMLWILFSARSRTTWAQTENLISKLVIITIGTGAVTVICGALTLALFITTVGASFQYLPAAYIWGKLYSNSAMVSLNSRHSTRVTTGSTPTDTDTFPMQVHVSRQVFQAGSRGEDQSGATLAENPPADESKIPARSYDDLDLEAFSPVKDTSSR